MAHSGNPGQRRVERGAAPPGIRELHRRLRDFSALTRILSEAESVEESLDAIIGGLRKALGVAVCDLWRRDEEAGVLRVAAISCARAAGLQRFLKESREMTFAPEEGLPGRVWISRKPLWIEDAPADAGFPRAVAAAQAGLRAAAAFPILIGEEFFGVIEIFARQKLRADETLVTLMETMGGQLGQFIRRQRAEAQLRQSQRELRDFVENAAVGLHWVGPDGVILWANRTELEMLGYSAEEYIGCHIREFHADTDAIEDILTRLSRREELHDYEARLICRDGSVRHASISSNVLWVDDRFVHTRCFTRDITARKEAEAAREASERRFTSFMEHLPGAAWIKDADGRYVYANQYAQKIFRTPTERLLGRTDEEVFPVETARQFQENDNRALRSEGGVQTEEQLEHEDGIHDSIVSKFPIFDRRGRVAYVGGVAIDITEKKKSDAARRESEERLRFTLQAARVGSWDWDIRTGAVTWSDNLEALHGKPPGSFGETFDDVLTEVYPADRPEIERAIRAALEGDGIFEVEYRYVRPDGSLGWLHGQGRATFDESGRPARMVGICMDVTERRESERRLREARRAAEAASRAKSEFLANVSHEIRTPMTAILGFAEVLARKLEEPEDLECLETIRRNGQFLLDIIGDVLDLSKIEAGKLEVERERFRLDDLLREVHTLMAVRAREKELSLYLEVQGRIPETIESDPTRLRQILINLLSNAIKFTERGGVRLVARLVEDAPMMRFEVIDTGIGMRPEQERRLFRPFAQADSSVTRRYGGSGIGLALCQRLTRMLGGEISVETEEGKGSTVTATVCTGPLDGVRLVEPRPEAPSPSCPTPHSGALHCRVLVVDDHDEVRDLMRCLLEDAGCEVEDAGDGRRALDAVREAESSGRPIDVVLMDMQMPVIDGYETTSRLRASGYRGSIIALTAHALREDREKCIAAGCVDYVSKPVDYHKLLATMARHTAGPPGAVAAALSERGEADRLSEGPSTHSPNRCRVLLVDDDPDLRRLLSHLLGRSGHEVRSVGTGLGAVEVAASFRPHVVILDLGLPDITGRDAALRLRRLPGLEHTVFIAHTGRDVDLRDDQLGSEPLFHHHVVKPVDVAELERLFPAPPGDMSQEDVVASS